jgi:hypothetical protein
MIDISEIFFTRLSREEGLEDLIFQQEGKWCTSQVLREEWQGLDDLLAWLNSLDSYFLTYIAPCMNIST